MKHEVSAAQLRKRWVARGQRRYDLLDERVALPKMIRKTVERLAALRARKKEMPAAIEQATADWSHAKDRWQKQHDRERTAKKIGSSRTRILKLQRQLRDTGSGKEPE